MNRSHHALCRNAQPLSRAEGRSVPSSPGHTALILLTLLIWPFTAGGLTGCQIVTGGASGPIRLEQISSDSSVRLTPQIVESAHMAIDRSEASFIVHARSDERGRGTIEHFVHVTMLWLPRAGSTPMDRTATNATVHWVIRAGDEVGVYAGAGYARLRGPLGRSDVTLQLADATIRLIASTDGFRDPLTPGHAVGEFSAPHDPARHAALLRESRAVLEQRFGHTDSIPRELTRLFDEGRRPADRSSG